MRATTAPPRPRAPCARGRPLPRTPARQALSRLDEQVLHDDVVAELE
jgi:hypothetical protein